ncbi:MAG: hypothetical protein WA839_04120 [Flavobacteriaceae bacterium]
MAVFKFYLKSKIFYLCVLLFFAKISCFSQNNDAYSRFVDSANVYIDSSSEKAKLFLDSIPNPINKNIQGSLADYYSIKALLYEDDNLHSKMYQSFILASKYADIENNCMVGGQVNLELFSDVYFIKNDTTAYKYLQKAKKHFETCNYDYGLLEVKQMYCYVQFVDGNYKVCNNLILKDLSAYKNVKDEDAYLYLFSTFMLVCNYLDLDDFKNAKKYLKEFKSLKNHSTISKYNYITFESEINLTKAHVFYKKKELDSTHYYLKEVSKNSSYLTEELLISSYSLYSDYYKSRGNLDLSDKYIDSLLVFKNKIFNENIHANIDLTDSLSDVETKLTAANNKKFLNIVLIFLLVSVLILLSMLYLIFYKKSKFKLNNASNEVNKLTYIKSNNEKLTVKVQGLEGYINSLKREVKEISTLDNSCQRERIKEFYTKLHHNSSTLLDKTNNHIELVNDLNVDFFNKVQEKFPQLTNSETVICYYLFIGFKNKEIAVFLNSSVRAIESKRYRITKKLGLNDINLLDYIKNIHFN